MCTEFRTIWDAQLGEMSVEKQPIELLSVDV